MRNSHRLYWVLIASCLPAFGISEAATLHVPAEYATIAEAVSAAVDGDEVRVAPGTYSGPGNKNITFQGKDLNVIGDGGAAVTIIDLDGFGRAFSFDHTGEPNTASVEGFTIRNGDVYLLAEAGGGILCVGASVAIRDCVIENCVGAQGGGGIEMRSPTSTEIAGCVVRENHSKREADGGGRGAGISVWGPVHVRDCLIEDNLADPGYLSSTYGGGIAAFNGVVVERCQVFRNRAVGFGGFAGARGGGIAGHDVTILACDVRGNSADEVGGGIFATGDVLIEGCIVTGNSSVSGGGIATLEEGAVIVTQSTIASNQTSGSFYGGHLPQGGGGIFCDESTDLTLDAVIVWNNCAETGAAGAYAGSGSVVSFTCCDFSPAGNGGSGQFVFGSDSFEADPLFCDVLPCDQAPAVSGDYRLRVGSPCLPGGNDCGLRIGAEDSGCGLVPVVDTSWGEIKSLFR